MDSGRPAAPPYPGDAMTATPDTAAPRTYEVNTYGCQMNVHDSERLTGLLEDAGYALFDKQAPSGRAGRRRRLQHLRGARERRQQALRQPRRTSRRSRPRDPGMQIAVGGCLAQKDRATITDRAPYVDVVFGTHNIGSLPVLLERARVQEEAQVEILESLDVFPSHAAHQARVGVRRVGLDLASGATTPARSASCRRCAARRRTAAPATSSPRSGAGRRGRLRGDPAGPERQRLRRRVRRPAGLLASCCAPAATSRAWSGCGSPARTRPSSPTTSSRRWPRRPT